MFFHIGLENSLDGRSIAWALEHPGCFAYGPDSDTALQNLPAAIREYAAWIARHTPSPWLTVDEISLHVEETFEAYLINEKEYERVTEDGYEVESFFLHDWKPLTEEDVRRALLLFEWNRADLMETVRGLTQEQLDRRYPNERWSIAGILGHVGGADWWYLDRLELAFPREEVPKEPFERLTKVRAHLLQTLPTLIGSKQVVGKVGEFWSPRKLLRRGVWHERDHIQHIQKILALPQ
jgi:uncharacterized damage-inducible protein DinB